ncbi:hypothetical protein ACHAW5_009104 [Stephanodiscus triporus]|uniref:Uncharacterized protein n=1 Tax=Stephanodiscus triporus TaxID=2934178 RepID=A0ABD3P5K7_9STRA
MAGIIMDDVQHLFDADARMLLVANAINMSTWVAAKTKGKTMRVLDAYNVLVSGHNELLMEKVSKFETLYPPLQAYLHDCPWHDLRCASKTVDYFDIFEVFECLNHKKDYFGIHNICNPCHPSQTDTDRSNNCDNLHGYKFWDRNHPTHDASPSDGFSMLAVQIIYNKEVRSGSR